MSKTTVTQNSMDVEFVLTKLGEIRIPTSFSGSQSVSQFTVPESGKTIKISKCHIGAVADYQSPDPVINANISGLRSAIVLLLTLGKGHKFTVGGRYQGELSTFEISLI